MKHRNLLRSVSRSFYLSIKFLPEAMRDPIALAYLLARMSDTIADSINLDPHRRVEMLEEIRSALLSVEGVPALKRWGDSLEHPGEKALLLATGEIMNWFHEMENPNRELIRDVISTIVDGQSWDVTFFQKGTPSVVSDAEQLLHYTYQVAGCVGEFWTDVGFSNLGEDFADLKNREVLREQGKQYGQALQLLNIIRDLHEDLPGGRCYLPAEDGRPGQEEIDRWLAICRGGLEEGKQYLGHLRNRRVRFATALPLHLAEATARKLEEAGRKEIVRSKVKVSRKTVWKMMIKSVFS